MTAPRNKRVTANQKEYQKQIDRMKRFEKKYHVKVDMPEQPKRITKKDVQELKELKGKKLLERSTVEIAAQVPLHEEEFQVGEQVNALEFLEAITNGSDDLQANSKAFISQTRFQQSAQNGEGQQWEDTYIQSFEEGLSQYRPEFQNIMSKWARSMAKKLGITTFVNTLQSYEQEFGGIGKAEAYNLSYLVKWLTKFAARIENPKVREAAIHEIEEMENDKSLYQDYYDYKAFKRKQYYRRSKR